MLGISSHTPILILYEKYQEGICYRLLLLTLTQNQNCQVCSCLSNFSQRLLNSKYSRVKYKYLNFDMTLYISWYRKVLHPITG